MFVDIIHTNSGNLWDGCLSIPQPLGHIDFYPAGGSHQPGCTAICVGSMCLNYTIEDLIKGGCSHDRANQYFIESIASSPGAGLPQFLASSCHSWEEWVAGECCDQLVESMGAGLLPTYPAPPQHYFLNVRKKAPFALGVEGIPAVCRHRRRDYQSYSRHSK